MSLTTIVGAFLAAVARPANPWDRLEKLTRSQQKLIDHIEDLEREVALQQSLTTHWKGEAQNLARSNRELREAEWTRYAQANLQMLANNSQVQQNARMYDAMRAQMQADIQPSQLGQQNACQSGQSIGQTLNPQLFQQAMLQSQQYEGRCNCVPGRAQVWQQHGLVQKLNDNTET